MWSIRPYFVWDLPTTIASSLGMLSREAWSLAVFQYFPPACLRTCIHAFPLLQNTFLHSSAHLFIQLYPTNPSHFNLNIPSSGNLLLTVINTIWIGKITNLSKLNTSDKKVNIDPKPCLQLFFLGLKFYIFTKWWYFDKLFGFEIYTYIFLTMSNNLKRCLCMMKEKKKNDRVISALAPDLRLTTCM